MSQSMKFRGEVSRRSFLTVAGAGVVAAATAGIVSPAAHASTEDMQAAIKMLIGDKQPTSGKIALNVPQIAENGRTVPVTVSVDSPMTAANHVKSIHLFAEGNPNPDVASFHLSPMNGVAEVSTRMRLAKTQNVVAVAELSDGSVWTVSEEVKVTIGGCGG